MLLVDTSFLTGGGSDSRATAYPLGRYFDGLSSLSTHRTQNRRMGLCFGLRLNPRLRCNDVPFHSPHSFTNSPIFLSSVGGRETVFNHTRFSLLSTIYEEGETLQKLQKDFGKTFAFSSAALEAPESELLQEGIKVNKRGKRSLSSMHEMIDSTQLSFGESHFHLLMENLGVLEQTFADSKILRLERDIILQLGMLGALELFNVCLTRSFGASLEIESDHTGIGLEQVEGNRIKCKVDDCTGKVVVRSSKKKENKTRRKGASIVIGASTQSLPLGDDQEDLIRSPATFVKGASNTNNRRILIAKREAQMSEGVKVLARLEKIRTAIEEDTKQTVTSSIWADTSGVDEKMLQQQLYHGYYCRDELIRSTRSLVLYFARKYRGMGIALEDLLQAGYIGVLQGAERFDSTRGYRFSTYVQYWIRKSMSRMVTRYARGVTIPWSMSRAINQIKKARKVLKNNSIKYPDDHEIAKMTGLSLDRIRSASNCLRIVASMNQKMGDRGVAYMDLIPDMSIESPEEGVMKQHFRKDVYDLLNVLDSRERQILTLRFGLNDHQPKSLEYIGRIFEFSKEWIRKIEKKALTKLRLEATTSKLHYYLD